ncbi:MAG: hypothetical protein MUE46_11900 [Xanthomonadales bacterium]|jgi:hypothetical protein|nr:hypothetical protein [Xanthomonadales bacterium]
MRVLIVSTLLLAACSRETPPPAPAPPAPAAAVPVLQPQLQALDRAREVQGAVDAAKARVDAADEPSPR